MVSLHREQVMPGSCFCSNTEQSTMLVWTSSIVFKYAINLSAIRTCQYNYSFKPIICPDREGF